MRQRVMIALALSCNPSVLIADEPTTALDVTIQAQILQRMRELRDETGAAIILVTHDLGVVADIADRIAVMYAGRIVEQGTLDEIFYDPQHPYTWGLLGSIARVDRPRPERLPAIAGLPPSLADRPQGCHFRPRCPHEFGKCREVPPLEARLDGQPDAPRPLLAHAPRRSASAARCGRVRSGSRPSRRRERRRAETPSRRERLPRRRRAPEGLLPDQGGVHRRPRGRARARGERRDLQDRRGGDASGSWASRAAARPRCRGRSCA